MDPLSLLREFTKNKQPIEFKNNKYFIFKDVKYPRDAKTAYKSMQGTEDYYTLDAVWFLLQHANKSFSDYIVECRTHNFPRVSLVDRQDLLEYVRGTVESSPYVSDIPPDFTPLPVKRGREDENEEPEEELEAPSAKRSKTADTTTAEPSQTGQTIQELELDEKLIQGKQEVARKIEASKGAVRRGDTSEELPSLGEGLTPEKIKELQEKRRQKKRTTLGAEDELIIAKRDENSNFAQFLQADAKVTKEIISRERPLRTSTAVLQSPKKSFEGVVALMRELLSKETARKPEPATAHSYDRYNVDQTRFWKERLGSSAKPGGAAAAGDAVIGDEDFTIDTRGSFANPLSMAEPEPAAVVSTAPRPPPASKQSRTGHGRPGSTTTAPPRNPADTIPIIIVPPSLTTLLTTYNAKEFLVDGEWHSPADRKQAGAKKETAVKLLRRKPDGTLVEYHVIDNPLRLSDAEWNRVVAVFVLGAAWQFKNWKWSTPLQLFSNVRGFYLGFDDEKVPDVVKQWDVKILALSKHKRHLDRPAAMQIWLEIDAWCKLKKPHLNY